MYEISNLLRSIISNFLFEYVVFLVKYMVFLVGSDVLAAAPSLPALHFSAMVATLCVSPRRGIGRAV